MTSEWLAVAAGNTHQRWGWFEGNTLLRVEQFSREETPSLPPAPEIWLATVGPPTATPQDPRVRRISPEGIPLSNAYPGLGVDRALTLLAAGERYGYPTLVIDAGTALTFSAADASGSFAGGAILPGLGLQARALHGHTAALPLVSFATRSGPIARWGHNTTAAIQSGILHTALAGILSFAQDWQAHFPGSRIVLTGGDGPLLHEHLPNLNWDPHLLLYGIALVRQLSPSQDSYPQRVNTTHQPLD